MKFLICAICILFSCNLPALSRLDDLDKNPVGAYGGQALFGASISLGIPSGSLMAAEDSFVQDTTYTFTEQEITKTVVISHLNYSASLFGEYMFVDRFGARLTLNRNYVIQRTHFGKNYKNESYPLFQDVAFLLGPTIHSTIREPWDVVFIPQLGLSMASYDPAPCADVLFTDFSQDKVFEQNIFVFGIEVHGMYYFENGVFVSAGIAYTHITLEHEPFGREAPEPVVEYNDGKSEATLGLTRFIVSFGYALFH